MTSRKRRLQLRKKRHAEEQATHRRVALERQFKPRRLFGGIWKMWRDMEIHPERPPPSAHDYVFYVCPSWLYAQAALLSRDDAPPAP